MADNLLLTEEEQAERVKAWWGENGASVIVGAVVGISAIVGYNYWQEQRNQTIEEASAEYNLLLEAMNEPDSAKARELGALILEAYGDTAYATKAALIQAKLQADSGELDDALESLILARDNADESGLVHVANLRIARIYLEQGEVQIARETMASAAGDHVGFESQYLEIEGDIAFVEGDIDLARQKYTESLSLLSSDPAYVDILQLKISSLGSATSQ